MLDMLFGFNIRLGRLKFFLISMAAGVVYGLVALPVAWYAYKSGMLVTPPRSMWQAGWPIVAFAAFCVAGNLFLASMRFRDIGWDPVIMIPCWIVVMVGDPMIASRVPAMALSDHDGTVVGALVNLGLYVILLFWPGGDHADSPAVFDRPASAPPRAPTPAPSSLSSERMTRATSQFGRRA
jgi:uncharacterized membrane protein YhaH (DUF805 family)